MENFLKDIRYAVRMLIKKPGFTAVAVLSLTLGIGANTTIFTLIKAIFLQNVPVKDPSHVIIVFSNQQTSDGKVIDFIASSYLNSVDYREKNTVFSGLSIVWGTGANLDVSGTQQNVFVQLVNHDYFDIMGVPPSIGRSFAAEEDKTPGASAVAILSNGLWKRQFGGDPKILGQTIRLNGQDFNVVGIMPPQFRNLGLFGSPDIWVPMTMHDQVVTGVAKDWYKKRAFRMVFMVARMKPDESLARVQSAMHNLGVQLAREYPTDNSGRNVTVMPISETSIPPAQRATFVLAGTLMMVIVGFVLLVACGNVANLLLARATQRRRELAVRLSLGASRGRILRQLLTESLMIGLLAGALGILTAYWGRNLLSAFLPDGIIRGLDLSINVEVLIYTLALSLVATAAFGLIPALQASKVDQISSLRDRTDAPSSVGRWYGLRGILVMAQVALSLIALAGAGLFIHSLRNAQKMDPGFETKHELLVFLNFGQLRYSPAQTEQVEEAVTQRVRALPMVVAAGMADTAPLSPNTSFTTFPDGTDASDPRNAKLIPATVAQPGYFSAMNMAIIKGRDLDEHDDANGAKVVVINQALADKIWPGEDPLGKRMSFLAQPDKVTVVGVVATVKYQTLGEPPQPVNYFPMKQRPQQNVTLHVRVQGDPNSAVSSVAKVITDVDSNLRNPQIRTVPWLMEQILQPEMTEAELLGGFGFLALLLAAIGTYGVMSYSVGQRTQEIGIRMALGAQRRDVMRLMLGTGMAMVMGGVVAGLVVTLLVTHSLNSLLYGIGIFDPVSFFATAIMMILVALIACWIPSRRAMRVSPIIALRYE